MAIYAYKTQESSHGKRLQNIEESFSKGMQFTNTPLPEGLLKTIVNMDINDAGASLSPRPGLRATHGYIGGSIPVSQIVLAKEQAVYDRNCPQFFVKPVTVGTDPYIDAALTLMYGTDTDATGTTVPGVSLKTAQTVSYTHALYGIPVGAEIHGVPVEDPTTMAKHIGVTGWNNNYYFFNSTDRRVVHTEWNAETSAFQFIADEPKVITSKEAVTWGYNMLQENPYVFEDLLGAVGSPIVFSGMLPYDVAGELSMAPVINQSLIFRTFYQVDAGKKYSIKWEWRSASGQVWTELQESDVTFTEPFAPLEIAFSPPEEGIILRISAYGYTGEVKNTYTDATLAVGFSFRKEDYGSTANTQPKTYSVIEAKGMTYWKNKLVAWGVPEDSTMLFVSDVNDPTYFPYPNNTDVFNEPIRYAVPFLDYLLVFTTSRLHLLTPSADGLGWTNQVIQNNLTISDWDTHLIQVVKNMVFFRSGNYFYMIVPKSGSASGELTVAPISKPLYYFFDHFMDNVKEIVSETYQYDGTLSLVHYYNFLDFEDVHNIYVFETEDTEYLNFDLLYNTVSRTWRIYLIGSQGIMIPYKADATQRGTLCTAGSNEFLIPQLLKFIPTNHSDFYIPHGIGAADCETVFSETHTFLNWQYIDTGYREHSSNFKKRYRELQFVINNISNRALNFYTDFYIDGEARKERYAYEVVQELDNTSPNYGIITVERTLADPLTAPNTTQLVDDPTDTSGWTLDVSMFPEVSFWKARQMVTGKGYTPRFFLICHDEAAYELLNISWVYRAMYSR